MPPTTTQQNKGFPTLKQQLSVDYNLLLEIGMTPLFRGMSQADLMVLLGDALIATYEEGTDLFVEGKRAECFYILLNGYVELFRDIENKRNILEIVGTSQLLGEAGLFDDGIYPHSARNVSDSRLLVIPSAIFLRALNKRFDLALRMLNSMSGRLHGLVGQVTQLKLKTTAQRLASFLLGLTATSTGTVTVRFPYDKKLAADHLGMTAESLSRALQKLSKVGVTSSDSGTVIIEDLYALRLFSIEEN